jgi:MerR family copper efflux transcriptional regulator
MKGLSTTQVAEKAGVSPRMVRHYARRGLLETLPANGSRRRQFPAIAILRMQLIRRGLRAGFTLEQLGEVLSLRARQATSRLRRAVHCQALLREIEERMQTLKALRSAVGVLQRAVSETDPQARQTVARAGR